MAEYRFKTMHEFERDLGSGWRQVAFSSFVAEMDFLLGTELNREDNEKANTLTKDSQEHFRSNGCGYQVSMDMLIGTNTNCSILDPNKFKVKPKLRLNQDM